MKPCKRIEIVIEEAQAERLAERLEQLGAPGYTQIPRANGRGDRGVRRGDDPAGTLTNCVFIVACDADTATRVVEGIRGLLTRSGGICLVSDAAWLHH